MSIYFPFCLVDRARKLFSVLDRGSGGRGLVSADAILDLARPSPRAIQTVQLRRTSELNLAILELSKVPPKVLIPNGAAATLPFPMPVGETEDGCFFETAWWLIRDFGRFTGGVVVTKRVVGGSSSGAGASKTGRTDTSGSSSQATLRLYGSRKKKLSLAARKMSPFLDPEEERKDKIKQERERRKREKERKRSLSPGGRPSEAGAEREEGAAENGGEEGAMLDGDNEEAMLEPPDGADEGGSSPGGSPTERDHHGGTPAGAPPLDDEEDQQDPLEEERRALFGSDPSSSDSSDDEEDELGPRSFTLRCAPFYLTETMVELELHLPNPSRSRRKWLSLFLRADKFTWVRAVFFAGGMVGLPRDLFFEHSSMALGEEQFLNDFAAALEDDDAEDDLFGGGAGVVQGPGAAAGRGAVLGSAVGGKKQDTDSSPAGGSSSAVSSAARKQSSPKQATEDDDDSSAAATGAAKANENTTIAAAAALPLEEPKQLSLGVVLLQDLKTNPDVLETPGEIWTGETNKLRAKWTLKLSLKMLQLYYPRGVGVKSPVFKLKRDGPFQLELFPNGSTACNKAGACSVRLWAPKMRGSLCLVNFYSGNLEAKLGAGAGSSPRGDGEGEQTAGVGAAGSVEGGLLPSRSSSRAVVTKVQELRLEKDPDINFVMLDEFCQASDLLCGPDAGAMGDDGEPQVTLGVLFKRLPLSSSREKLKDLAKGLDLASIVFADGKF